MYRLCAYPLNYAVGLRVTGSGSGRNRSVFFRIQIHKKCKIRIPYHINGKYPPLCGRTEFLGCWTVGTTVVILPSQLCTVPKNNLNAGIPTEPVRVGACCIGIQYVREGLIQYIRINKSQTGTSVPLRAGLFIGGNSDYFWDSVYIIIWSYTV